MLFRSAHLVLVPQTNIHRAADFGLSTQGQLTLDNPHFIFSGIAVYQPAWFLNEAFRRFSLSPLLRTWAKHDKISGELHTGTWVDIGTPERLHYLQHYLATPPATTSR